MPSRYNPARCKYCGRSKEEAGGVSHRGMCERCALERHAMNTAQLQAQEGPYARYWAAKLADRFGMYALDELPPKP